MADCRLGCIPFFALSFVVDVISFATPYWYTAQREDVEIHGGLWQQCVDGVACISTPDNVGAIFQGVQALMTLGLIMGILGVIAAASLYAGISDTKLRALGILSFLAGVLSVAGAGVFSGQFIVDPIDSSWSLYLAYVAAAGYVLTGPMFLISQRRETYQALP